LKPSLSVVVPLHNVQSTLVGMVEDLLEILPELTPRFEVVLVDDGSTDATRETAHELSLGFPQVQVIVQTARLGAQESLRAALRFSHGEFLLLCTDRPTFDLHDIRKLWNRRTDDGALSARVETRSPLGSIPRLPTTPIGDSSTPDLLLVPRRLLAGWQLRGERHDVAVYLRARGFVVENVEIRPRRPTVAKSAFRQTPARSTMQPTIVTVERARVSAAADRAPVRRPNLLLSKLRSLTRGE